MDQITRNVILLGAPGCGKGTLSELLEMQYHVHHFSTGDMLRQAARDKTPLGLKAAGLIDRGQFVSDDIIMGLIRERLDFVGKCVETAPVIINLFDGFPRTIPQAEALDRLLGESGARVDLVVSMECPEDVIAYRTANRCLCRNCSFIGSIPHISVSEDGERHCPRCNGILYQRKDDRPEVFRSRMDAFYKLTEPLVQYYTDHFNLVRVDSSRDIRTTDADVRIALDTLK